MVTYIRGPKCKKGLRLDSGSHLVADSLWQGEEAEKGVHCIARAVHQKVRKQADRMGRRWEEAGLPSDPLGVSEGAKPAGGWQSGTGDPPSPPPSRSAGWTHSGGGGGRIQMLASKALDSYGSVLTGCITFAGNLFSASIHSPHSFPMGVMPLVCTLGCCTAQTPSEGRAWQSRANRDLRPVVTDFGSTK